MTDVYYATVKPTAEAPDAMKAARAYIDHLDKLLEQGIVPDGLFAEKEKKQQQRGTRMDALIDEYLTYNGYKSDTDIELCKYVRKLVKDETTTSCNYLFVNKLISDLKLKHRLKPSSIRKRIDVLARIVDFHYSRREEKAYNNFKGLPRGYSIYNSEEAKTLIDRGYKVPTDEVRNRLINESENALIERALSGEKFKHKQRGFTKNKEFTLLYKLISIHGLRLREAFTLKREQIKLGRKKYIKVAGTKGHRGEIKYRDTPVRREFYETLLEHCKDKKSDDLIFPNLWSGDTSKEELKRTQMRLTSKFKNLFGIAGVIDLKQHDLRHYATVKWIQIRKENGEWLYHYADIQKIMGWQSIAMVERYASIRGDEIVNKLADYEWADLAAEESEDD